MDLVLGIDLGTTYFKVALCDRGGSLRGLGRVPVPKEAGDGTRCELPVDRFWELLRAGLGLACAHARCDPADVCAVAYSSQANSFLLLGRNNEPLTPLILWPDQRAATADPVVNAIFDRDDFVRTTGMSIPFSPLCAIAKCRWFQEREPEVWARTRRIMTISDYLTFGLTRQPVGDMGTASLLGILDLKNGRWWDDALRRLGISGAQLSTPLAPGTVAGGLDADAVQRLDLKPGIPLAVGGLDHHVASVGAGVGSIADASESTGTVVACVNYSKEYRPRQDCCLGPCVGGKGYYLLTFDDNGAGSLKWYQQSHAPELRIEELVKMAESVAPGSEGLVARPQAHTYDGLDGFINVSSSHHHGHFVRALMESTAATLRKLFDALCGDQPPERIIATGGGARSDLWLQLKADLLDVEFAACRREEPATIGACILAATAAGWFPNVEAAISAWVSVRKRFAPVARNRNVYAKWYRQNCAAVGM